LIKSGCAPAFEARLTCPRLALAGDDIKAFVKFCQHICEHFWWILQIAVHNNDDITVSAVESGGHCGLLTEVSGEAYYFNAWVIQGAESQVFGGSIGASVVDHNDFEIFG
jgi:hypothetical protein